MKPTVVMPAVPKGYLYAAIAFRCYRDLNQIALRNRRKSVLSIPPRQHTANAVLRLLGGVPLAGPAASSKALSTVIIEGEMDEAFAPSEKEMVRGVLAPADRPVSAIMTPRPDVASIDPDDPEETVLAEMRNSRHGQFLVSRGSIDEVVGIVRKEDVLGLCLDSKPFDIMAAVEEPIALRGEASVLETLDFFKRARSRWRSPSTSTEVSRAS